LMAHTYHHQDEIVLVVTTSKFEPSPFLLYVDSTISHLRISVGVSNAIIQA